MSKQSRDFLTVQMRTAHDNIDVRVMRISDVRLVFHHTTLLAACHEPDDVWADPATWGVRLKTLVGGELARLDRCGLPVNLFRPVEDEELHRFITDALFDAVIDFKMNGGG